MAVANARPLTVAVIGASTDRHKFGNKAVRAFRRQGYTVVPINPNATEIEGERAYASVLEYDGPIDEATMYVHGDVGVHVVEEIAKKGIKTVWLNPGADDDDVVERAQELGLKTIVACSILGVGESPGDY
jgi:predicted CoA-binding protein